MVNYQQKALHIHKKLKGKIQVTLKDDLKDMTKLSLFYTPGVGAVSSYLARHPNEINNYTWTNNNVAVVSDGSAVLGLGNIGPEAALPVMEGKCMLFKHFANIDAVPIVLNVHTAQEIIAVVKALSPSFGGINLEDIAAPLCFEIEKELSRELSIPVFHDDQHGTAIVVLAALLNAVKISKRNLNKCKIALVGAGAAGVAIAKLINKYALKAQIILLDSKGIISKNRLDLNNSKQDLLNITNPYNIEGGLNEALDKADIFIGVSQANLINSAHIKMMANDPIILALANPVPEIYPDDAKKAGARLIATGRSDFPNQVNNALAFPGIFRGALDSKISDITDTHKIEVAKVIASLIKKPDVNCFIPLITDKRLVPAIAQVIK